MWLFDLSNSCIHSQFTIHNYLGGNYTSLSYNHTKHLQNTLFNFVEIIFCHFNHKTMIPTPYSPNLLDESKKTSLLTVLNYVFLGAVILYFGKTLFIPLSFALLISFVLYPVCRWLENKGLNRSLSILICILGLVLVMFGIIYLLFVQIISFSTAWEGLKVKLNGSFADITSYFADNLGISNQKQQSFIDNFVDNSGANMLSFVRTTASSLSAGLFSMALIPILSALILFYRTMLVKVLYGIFAEEKQTEIYEILIQTIQTYYNFIKGMALVYLIVGILNSVGLLIIGVPHPFLFGFIASILTFIPYVGIMIAAMLPVAVSWAEFGSIWYPISVLIMFGVVQALESYLIFPFAVGGRLKINTLVIIVSIIIGGILWGAAGMILFIPFVSIIKLIADHSSSMKTWSLLLGDK